MNEIKMYYPGYTSDTHRVLDNFVTNINLGNREEADRLIREDFYEIFFRQREHLNLIYSALTKVVKSHGNPEPKKRFIKYIGELIIKNNEFLCNWSNDLETSMKFFEKIYTPQLNDGEGK